MLIADTHVHLYSFFNLQTFFDCGEQNFSNIADQYYSRKNVQSIIVLTDWAKQNWFGVLRGFCEIKHDTSNKSLRNWSFHCPEEKISLIAKNNKTNQNIIILAGRKIITKENLELLALITNKRFPDNNTLTESVKRIIGEDAIPVIPWAPGKWIGRRGNILKQFIARTNKPNFFLSDNGNRPAFWPRPSIFESSEKKGIKILAGSDPLHFSRESKRVGTYVCATQGSLSLEYPGNEFKQILLDPSTEIIIQGRLENAFRFFRNQLAMQILKKKYKKVLSEAK